VRTGHRSAGSAHGFQGAKLQGYAELFVVDRTTGEMLTNHTVLAEVPGDTLPQIGAGHPDPVYSYVNGEDILGYLTNCLSTIRSSGTIQKRAAVRPAGEALIEESLVGTWTQADNTVTYLPGGVMGAPFVNHSWRVSGNVLYESRSIDHYNDAKFTISISGDTLLKKDSKGMESTWKRKSMK